EARPPQRPDPDRDGGRPPVRRARGRVGDRGERVRVAGGGVAPHARGVCPRSAARPRDRPRPGRHVRPAESPRRPVVPLPRPEDQARGVTRRGLPVAARIGLVMPAAVTLAALFAPQLAPHAHDDQDLGRALLPPVGLPGADRAYLLGTDYLGRDLLSRLVVAARTSLALGLAAVVVAGPVRLPPGLVAGVRP